MSADDSFRFAAIGTDWQIDTERPMPEALRHRICALAEEFDHVWSRFRTDSLITRIAHTEGGGRFEFPARDVALLDLYDRLVAATAGGVDPLVGRDLELLGYDARYSLVRDDADIAGRRRRDSWARDIRREQATITTDRPVVIDVGAAGKGYLVDLIAHTLLDAGLDGFVVDGSGDLRHRGGAPVTVGLEHPTLSGRVIGTVSLRDAALCASATNRRTWGEGLHHVLDGRTRRPVTDVVATWAIAADAATADGLATALFVSDPARLRSFPFRWVRMLADGRVQWSNDFDGELFLWKENRMTSAILTRAASAAAASVAVIVPLAGCGSGATPSAQPPSASTSSSPRGGTSAGGTEYKDGTYTVRGVYGGAPSYLTVTVMLSADTVTKVIVEPMPDNNETSRGYQERFAAAVPDEVTGKSIDDLKVGKLAGASGCADGFNDALAKIREEASTRN